MTNTILPLPHVKPEPLVVYLSLPNRYDYANGKLLSGPPGQFIRDTLRDRGLDPDGVTYTTDLRYNPGVQHNKLLCGYNANKWLGFNRHLALNEARGYVTGAVGGGECISTFDPVDCTDVVNHEPESFERGDLDDEDADSGSTNKDSAPTQRGNYRFWFRSDVEKLVKKVRRRNYKYETITNWNTGQICKWLNERNSEHLYFDIETHPPSNTVQCFTIASGDGPAIVVPVYDHRGSASHDLPKLFSALSRAFVRNTVVGHNISFDLGFLFHFHGVPFSPRIYDTMLAQHRSFPEAEKSLAHTMSYWGNFPLHKGNAGTFTPYNRKQYDTLLEYNARDVLVLRAIHLEQILVKNRDSGLRASVAEANASIYPYLCASFTGFVIDTRRLQNKQSELKAKLTDLLRVLRILVGSVEFNPASNKQVGEWLYKDGLGYPVLETTEAGANAVDMKTLYRLIIKYPKNVALKLLITFKELDKTRGMMDFQYYHINEKR